MGLAHRIDMCEMRHDYTFFNKERIDKEVGARGRRQAPGADTARFERTHSAAFLVMVFLQSYLPPDKRQVLRDAGISLMQEMRLFFLQ